MTDDLERLEALAKELAFLVGLNDAEKGGPYQGVAAQRCVEAMRQTSATIPSIIQRVREAKAHVERLQLAVGEASKTAWARGRSEALEEAAALIEDCVIGPHGPYEVRERLSRSIRALGEKAG